MGARIKYYCDRGCRIKYNCHSGCCGRHLCPCKCPPCTSLPAAAAIQVTPFVGLLLFVEKTSNLKSSTKFNPDLNPRWVLVIDLKTISVLENQRKPRSCRLFCLRNILTKCYTMKEYEAQNVKPILKLKIIFHPAPADCSEQCCDETIWSPWTEG